MTTSNPRVFSATGIPQTGSGLDLPFERTIKQPEIAFGVIGTRKGHVIALVLTEHLIERIKDGTMI